ncbi:hypothetical protein L204_105264 [Cryptococcus depauperatus]|nr:hypothetical protein L204_06350 [Cryptococcus depauperatus CBS 7855]
MYNPPPTPILPTSHPLIIELTSLRSQLAQYQHAAHTAGIQLQGARLEAALAKEREESTKQWGENLEREVEILRANPLPSPMPPASTVLSEMSLAHRRLSSKLDFTESQLSSTALQLAQAQQDVQRLTREREGDRAVINELKRVEDEKEEEVEWERYERKRIEEQKKLVDLALQEYRELVEKLDPKATPPPMPSQLTSLPLHNPSSALQVQNEKIKEHAFNEVPTIAQSSTSEVISNLLIGQRGVQQLFDDFTDSLISKERQISSLQAHVESLENSLYTVKQQLKEETEKRVEAEGERDEKDREDRSAAHVIERYMTFTQKTHTTIHMHLDNLRTRSQTTIASLRNELSVSKNKLTAEKKRSEKLRAALEELSEGMSRESAGRRREVATRLKMIAQEERRARKAESWLNKVQRMNYGAQHVSLEVDVLRSLIDEGAKTFKEQDNDDVEFDRQKSWRSFIPALKKQAKLTSAAPDERNPAEESLARVLLAEELVATLVGDMQYEAERRMDLEKQRIRWLSQEEAGEGDKTAGDENGQVVSDLEELHNQDERTLNDMSETQTSMMMTDEKEKDTRAKNSTETSTLIAQLQISFSPLTTRYTPLQTTLHDLSHSLSSLRASLPSSPPSTPTTKSEKRASLLSLAKMPVPKLSTNSGSTKATLLTLLDALHEVIEDARVDVEIALADIERIYCGYEALFNVTHPSKKEGEEKALWEEVKEFVEIETNGGQWKRLSTKVEDIESDLAGLKSIAHEMEGMEIMSIYDGEKPEISGRRTCLNGDQKRRKENQNMWHGVRLRTVSIQPLPSSLVSLQDFQLPRPPLFSSNSFSAGDTKYVRRTSGMLSNVNNLGRSFSAGVLGAPRRVTGVVGGLYRGSGREDDKREVKEAHDDVDE